MQCDIFLKKPTWYFTGNTHPQQSGSVLLANFLTKLQIIGLDRREHERNGE